MPGIRGYLQGQFALPRHSRRASVAGLGQVPDWGTVECRPFRRFVRSFFSLIGGIAREERADDLKSLHVVRDCLDYREKWNSADGPRHVPEPGPEGNYDQWRYSAPTADRSAAE